MTQTKRITNLRIKATCTQLGLCIEASQDGGEWQTVQLSPYKTRKSTSVMQYSTFIDPARDEEEYFDEITKRGIQFERVRQ